MNFKNIKHQTNYWCRTKGIHSADLTKHSCIDDVILIIKFADEFWNYTTKSQKVSLECFWDWCYKQKKPLRTNHLHKLQEIFFKAQNNKLYTEQRRQQQRQQIKQLRYHHFT